MASPLKFRNAATLLLALVVFAVGLSELYQFLATFIAPLWLATALINTLLAAVVLYILFSRAQPSFVTKAEPHPWWRKRKALAYLPALIILLGAVLLGFISGHGQTNAIPSNQLMSQWAWILWIPVIEEIVFRMGFGGFFRRHAGRWWGSYFSVLLFAWLHAQPTLANLAAGYWLIPLGPLLLAVCCEAIYQLSGRILPAIAFHLSCNATVLIFALSDPIWLERLDFLYQKG